MFLIYLDRATDAFKQMHTNETQSDTSIEILEKTVDMAQIGIIERN